MSANASSYWPIYAEAQRQGVAVLLSGHGGDHAVTSYAWEAINEFAAHRRWGLIAREYPSRPRLRPVRAAQLRLGRDPLLQSWQRAYATKQALWEAWLASVLSNEVADAVIAGERALAAVSPSPAPTPGAVSTPTRSTTSPDPATLPGSRRVRTSRRRSASSTAGHRSTAGSSNSSSRRPPSGSTARGLDRYLHRRAVEGLIPDSIRLANTKNMGRWSARRRGDAGSPSTPTAGLRRPASRPAGHSAPGGPQGQDRTDHGGWRRCASAHSASRRADRRMVEESLVTRRPGSPCDSAPLAVVMVADPTPLTLANLRGLSTWADLLLTEGTTTIGDEPREPLRAGWRDLLNLEPPRLRVITTELAGEAMWQRERIQRDSCAPVLSFEDPDRTVLMVDSDEFLEPADVLEVVGGEPDEPVRLGLVPLYGAIDRVARSIHCCYRDEYAKLRDPGFVRTRPYIVAAPSVARARHLRGRSPSGVRFRSKLIDRDRTFGTHVTMTGPADELAWKLRNMRERWVPRVCDTAHLETMLAAGVHHAGWWIADYREPEPWLRELAVAAGLRVAGPMLPQRHLRALRGLVAGAPRPADSGRAGGRRGRLRRSTGGGCRRLPPGLDDWQRERGVEWDGRAKAPDAVEDACAINHGVGDDVVDGALGDLAGVATRPQPLQEKGRPTGSDDKLTVRGAAARAACRRTCANQRSRSGRPGWRVDRSWSPFRPPRCR